MNMYGFHYKFLRPQFGNSSHVKLFFHGFILFKYECHVFKTCMKQI